MTALHVVLRRTPTRAGCGTALRGFLTALLLNSAQLLTLPASVPSLGAHRSAGDSLAPSQRSFADKQTARPVGPGVWHHQIYSLAGPWAINVVEIDRRQPYLCFETVKARNRLHGLEKTSVMAAAADSERHRVVAAINGDFFDASGMPINLQVRRSEMLRWPATHSVFAVTADGAPLIEVFSASFQVRSADGDWHILHGLNRRRQSDEAILYTEVFGATTVTNDYGSEVRIELLGRFRANDTLLAVAKERRINAGNTPLAPSLAALSAHGAAQSWLDEDVAIGDTLLVVCALSPVPARARIVEAIGGLPRLVRDGAVSVETDREGGAKFANVRHPRTAVGFSADSSRIFLVTVDGRQPRSVGMTLYELADLMLSLGCSQALNLDGGGSTTMVVRGALVNHPSDATGERPVGNALLLTSQAPTGDLAKLSIEPRQVICPAGETVDFEAVATDSFFNPLALGDERFSWRLSSRDLGRLDGKGAFTAALSQRGSSAAEDSGYVLLSFRTGLRDSAKVVVTAWRALQLAPDSLVLEVGEARALQAILVDSRGTVYNKLPAQLRWEVEGGIGKISENGVFAATANGRGRVQAQFRNVVGIMPVVVRPKLLDVRQND